jgi:hypothetical protein
MDPSADHPFSSNPPVSSNTVRRTAPHAQSSNGTARGAAGRSCSHFELRSKPPEAHAAPQLVWFVHVADGRVDAAHPWIVERLDQRFPAAGAIAMCGASAKDVAVRVARPENPARATLTCGV